MEGVVDWAFRDLLTRLGGIDQCVTEFVRVTNRLLPDKVFLDYCPELKTNSRTRAGIPVVVQLLGGQPLPLAENAMRAVELGAYGIDLNFGCPAKTVNRHDGGATLLKYPERIQRISEAVRRAVPPHVPVTAKIRLGYDSPEMCIPVAQAVESAGLSTLIVHCRTKIEMYKPPARWEWIPQIKLRTKLNIIANGDISTLEDFMHCREITGCDEFMVGRGALANPFFFRQIKGRNRAATKWSSLQPLLSEFFFLSERFRSDYFAVARVKQWLSQLAKKHQEARELFDRLKKVTEPDEFKRQLLEFDLHAHFNDSVERQFEV